MALVAVETLFSAVAAEIARGRLQAAGIDALLFDDGIASLIGGGISGVRLMVASDDEAAARALLDDLAAADLATADLVAGVDGNAAPR